MGPISAAAFPAGSTSSDFLHRGELTIVNRLVISMTQWSTTWPGPDQLLLAMAQFLPNFGPLWHNTEGDRKGKVESKTHQACKPCREAFAQKFQYWNKKNPPKTEYLFHIFEEWYRWVCGSKLDLILTDVHNNYICQDPHLLKWINLNPRMDKSHPL